MSARVSRHNAWMSALKNVILFVFGVGRLPHCMKKIVMDQTQLSVS